MSDSFFESCSSFTKRAVVHLAAVERAHQTEPRRLLSEMSPDLSADKSSDAFRSTAISPIVALEPRTANQIQEAAEIRFPSLTPTGKPQLRRSLQQTRTHRTATQEMAASLVRHWGSGEKSPSWERKARAASYTRALRGSTERIFHLDHFSRRKQERIQQEEHARREQELLRAAAAEERERQAQLSAKYAHERRVLSYEQEERRLRDEKVALDLRHSKAQHDTPPFSAEDAAPISAADSSSRALCFPPGSRVRIASANASRQEMLVDQVKSLIGVDGVVLEVMPHSPGEKAPRPPHQVKAEFVVSKTPRVVVLPVTLLEPAWDQTVWTFPRVVSAAGVVLPLVAGEVILETCGDLGFITVRGRYLATNNVFAVQSNGSAPGFADLGVVTSSWPSAVLTSVSGSCDGIVGSTVVPRTSAAEAAQRVTRSRETTAARVASQTSGSFGSSTAAVASPSSPTELAATVSSPEFDNLGGTVASITKLVLDDSAALLELGIRASGNWIDAWDLNEYSCDSSCIPVPRDALQPLFIALKDVRAHRSLNNLSKSDRQSSAAALVKAARAVILQSRGLTKSLMQPCERAISLGAPDPLKPTNHGSPEAPNGTTVEIELGYMVDSLNVDFSQGLVAPWFSVPVVSAAAPFAAGTKAETVITFRTASVSSLYRSAITGASAAFESWPPTMQVKAMSLGALGGNIGSSSVRPHLVIGVQENVQDSRGLCVLRAPSNLSLNDDVAVSVLSETLNSAQHIEVFMLLLTPSAAQLSSERCFAQRISILVDASVLCQEALRGHLARVLSSVLGRLEAGRDAFTLNIVDARRGLGCCFHSQVPSSPDLRAGHSSFRSFMRSSCDMSSSAIVQSSRSMLSSHGTDAPNRHHSQDATATSSSSFLMRRCRGRSVNVADFVDFVLRIWFDNEKGSQHHAPEAHEGRAPLFETYAIPGSFLAVVAKAAASANGAVIDETRSATPSHSSFSSSTRPSRSRGGQSPAADVYIPELVIVASTDTLGIATDLGERIVGVTNTALSHTNSAPSIRLHWVEVALSEQLPLDAEGQDRGNFISAILQSSASKTRGSYTLIDTQHDPSWTLRLTSLTNFTSRVSVSSLELSFPHMRHLEIYHGLRDLRCCGPLLITGRYTHMGIIEGVAEAISVTGQQANSKQVHRRQLITKTNIPFSRFMSLRRLTHLASEKCYSQLTSEVKTQPGHFAGNRAIDRAIRGLSQDREAIAALLDEACQFAVPFAVPGSSADAAVLLVTQLSKGAASLNPFSVSYEKRPLAPLLASSSPQQVPPGNAPSWLLFAAERVRLTSHETGPCHRIMPTGAAARRYLSARDVFPPQWFTVPESLRENDATLRAQMLLIIDEESAERRIIVEKEWHFRAESEHSFASQALGIQLRETELAHGIALVEEAQRLAHYALLGEENTAWGDILRSTALQRHILDNVNRRNREDRQGLILEESSQRTRLVDQYHKIASQAGRALCSRHPTTEMFDEFVQVVDLFSASDLHILNVLCRALALWLARSSAAATLFGMHGAPNLCKRLLIDAGAREERVAESLCLSVERLALYRTNHGSLEAIQVDRPVRKVLESHLESPATQCAAMKCLARLCGISSRSRIGFFSSDAAGVRVVLAAIQRASRDSKILRYALKVLALLSAEPTGALSILELDGQERIATSLFAAAQSGPGECSTVAQSHERLLNQYFVIVARCAFSRETRGLLVDQRTPLLFILAALKSPTVSDATILNALLCTERLCGNIGDYPAALLATHLAAPLRHFVITFDTSRFSEAVLSKAYSILCRFSIASVVDAPPIDEQLRIFYRPTSDIVLLSVGLDLALIPAVYGEFVNGVLRSAAGDVPFVGRAVRHEWVADAMQHDSDLSPDQDDAIAEDLISKATSLYESLLQLHVADVVLSCMRGSPPSQLKCLGATLDVKSKWHVVMFEPPPRSLAACIDQIVRNNAPRITLRTFVACAIALYRIAEYYAASCGRAHGWLTLDNVFCTGESTAEWEAIVGPASPVTTTITAVMTPNPVVDVVSLHAHAADVESRVTCDTDAITVILHSMLHDSSSEAEVEPHDLRRAKLPVNLAELLNVTFPVESFKQCAAACRNVTTALERWLHANPDAAKVPLPTLQ